MVDLKYVDVIQPLLRNFKRKSDYIYNFSCPFCGDSKTKKLKARGYLYRYRDSLRYKCHKCDYKVSFGDLLSHLDLESHKQYVYDSFLEKHGEETKPKPKKKEYKVKQYVPLKPTVLTGCPSIATLGPDHPARIYIEGRKLPPNFLKQIFWTDDFPALVEKISPGHNLRKEGRIIIPFLDSKFQLLAIQGRILEDIGERYITIKAFADAPKIYGMHRLENLCKRIYVVEGPFDSMFLPNCIALAGSDIPPDLPVDNTLIVYDNEPRKTIICDKIEKAIERGFRVTIWPDTIKEKDINLMVIAGHEASKIRALIDRNSYTGLEAQERLRKWRKG